MEYSINPGPPPLGTSRCARDDTSNPTHSDPRTTDIWSAEYGNNAHAQKIHTFRKTAVNPSRLTITNPINWPSQMNTKPVRQCAAVEMMANDGVTCQTFRQTVAAYQPATNRMGQAIGHQLSQVPYLTNSSTQTHVPALAAGGTSCPGGRIDPLSPAVRMTSWHAILPAPQGSPSQQQSSANVRSSTASMGPAVTFSMKQNNPVSSGFPKPGMQFQPEPRNCDQSALRLGGLVGNPFPTENAVPVSLSSRITTPGLTEAIPWDVTLNDIRQHLAPVQIPVLGGLPMIHVLMVRDTGKTKSDAFVELATAVDANLVIREKQRRILRGRIVTLSPSSQEELMRSIFPSFRGDFFGVDAVPSRNELLAQLSPYPSPEHGIVLPPFGLQGLGHDPHPLHADNIGHSGPKEYTFLTRSEINQILAVCKNYKLFFSRKCAQRPFENVITILLKFPWHQKHLISTLQRDHLFEMSKLSIEALHSHISKPYHHIDSTLMDRMLRAILLVPAFTEKQKNILIGCSGQPCPIGFEFLLIPQSSEENEEKASANDGSENAGQSSITASSAPSILLHPYNLPEGAHHAKLPKQTLRRPSVPCLGRTEDHQFIDQIGARKLKAPEATEMSNVRAAQASSVDIEHKSNEWESALLFPSAVKPSIWSPKHPVQDIPFGSESLNATPDPVPLSVRMVPNDKNHGNVEPRYSSGGSLCAKLDLLQIKDAVSNGGLLPQPVSTLPVSKLGAQTAAAAPHTTLIASRPAASPTRSDAYLRDTLAHAHEHIQRLEASVQFYEERVRVLHSDQ